MRSAICLALFALSACSLDHGLPVVAEQPPPLSEDLPDLGRAADLAEAPADLSPASPECPRQDVPRATIEESCIEVTGCCSSDNGVAELEGCGTAPFTWVCFHGRCCHPRNGVTDLGE